MRRHLFAATAALALLASCTKETTQIIVPTEPYRPPFRVSGVGNVILEKTPYNIRPFFRMPLQVSYIHGDAQRVLLQFSGVPQGVRDSLSVPDGYPDFTTEAMFSYESATNGLYPVKLGAKTDTGKLYEYTFNLTVKGDTSCSGYLTSGSYDAFSPCNTAQPTYYKATMTQNGRGGDTLYVNNFENNSTALLCKVNCRLGTISIPVQTIGGNEYSGYGNVSAGSFGGGVGITLYLQKRNTGSSTTTSCEYFLTHD